MKFAALERISLVIVTWNGDDVLSRCLESILRVYDKMPETIVVDNANQESTRELVARYTNVRYLPLPENLGFAGGNNAALPFCTKDYLVLLNNDTELTADSISPLIEFLDAHPACAAVQGKVIFRANGNLDGCGGFFSRLGILSFRGAFVPDCDEFKVEKRVFTIGGAFFATRRRVVDELGALFYDHFRSYYEEIDYCCRLGLAGYECWYVPTPGVLHHHSVTAAKIGWRKIRRQYYRNIWFSTLTCFGWYGRIRLLVPIAALSAAQALLALLKGDTEPLRAHSAAVREMFVLRKLISETSHRVRKTRRLSDRAFLSFAIRSCPWRYYLRLARTGS